MVRVLAIVIGAIGVLLAALILFWLFRQVLQGVLAFIARLLFAGVCIASTLGLAAVLLSPMRRLTPGGFSISFFASLGAVCVIGLLTHSAKRRGGLLYGFFLALLLGAGVALLISGAAFGYIRLAIWLDAD